MNRIRHWQGITLPGLAVLAFNALAQSGGAAPQWGAHLDLEGKLGSQRSLGEADVFLPLSQDGRSLVFANLRGRFDDHDSREFNLGLGWRRMQADGWNLGGYGHFDRRRSATGNTFNQATLGAEALGPDWDWRANVYLPFGDRVRDLGADSSASLSGASIQVVTTSREERALKGFDAETGWRTPLFGRDDPRQLRLYFGGYRFSDDKVLVAGPRVRAELALEEMPALWKGAKLFLSAEAQYDSPRGSQGFLGLRLRIPLDKESRHGARSAQARRMTAPVVRDVDIVTRSRVSTLVETATATAGGQAITVLNSSTTTGAALPGAVAAAGANSTVILSGSFNTTAPVTLQTGQTLMGAGTLSVTTPSGRSASLTTPTATVSATVAANAAIRLANNSVLRGMTISSDHAWPGGDGVAGSGINGATIANNTITATGTAGVDALVLADSSDITVTGNSLSATSSAGNATALWVLIWHPPGASAVVNNNTLSAAGTNSFAIRLTSPDFPYVATVSGSGNVRAAGTCIVDGATVVVGSIGFTNGTTCPP